MIRFSWISKSSPCRTAQDTLLIALLALVSFCIRVTETMGAAASADVSESWQNPVQVPSACAEGTGPSEKASTSVRDVTANLFNTSASRQQKQVRQLG